MSAIESILYMLWRGIAIGILISAPMGPVGILCIQRTLDKGRHTGLFTGIGAAVSDLFYCLLTGFGLSFIEEFLERNSNILQLAGSVVLIAFGVYLFRKNPANSLKKPIEVASTTKRDILYGFLFTFSNPLIIFLIIGLFARFNFLLPEIKFYAYLTGYIGIAVGALGWWWVVTWFIDKVRGHFNLRSMWLINKIIAGIIFLFAIVGIATGIINLTSQDAHGRTIYMNRSRGYMPLSANLPNISNEFITLKKEKDKTHASTAQMPCDIASDNFSIQFRAASKGGYALLLSDDRNNTLHINIINRESNHILSTHPELLITASIYAGGALHEIAQTTIDENVNTAGGLNSLRISRNSTSESSTHDAEQNYMFSLSMGNRRLQHIMSFDLPTSIIQDFNISEISFKSISNSPVDISDIIIDIDDTETSRFCGYADITDLRRHVTKSKDKTEGVWKMLDSNFDTSRMAQGGDYTLAIARQDENYAIIYIEGASTASKNWTPGDIKGQMYPTSIPGIFDIEWLDSSRTPLKKGIKLQFETDDILSIRFPYQNATVRFQRLHN